MAAKVELTIKGMKCGGCENTIKKALKAKEGVISVETRHADDWVAIEFDETIIEEDDVLDVIESAGFEVAD